MSDKALIGFVCGKGHGHLQLAGEIDYGACRSKAVADVFVVVEEEGGLYPEYRDLMDATEVADELRKIVSTYDKWREEGEWDE